MPFDALTPARAVRLPIWNTADTLISHIAFTLVRLMLRIYTKVDRARCRSRPVMDWRPSKVSRRGCTALTMPRELHRGRVDCSGVERKSTSIEFCLDAFLVACDGKSRHIEVETALILASCRSPPFAKSSDKVLLEPLQRIRLAWP